MTSGSLDRVDFVGLTFDQIGVAQLVEQLISSSQTGGFRYLVTPNVDHVVRLTRLREAGACLDQLYENAEWCVCDSRILSMLSRLRGVALVTTPGSDLTAALFKRLQADGEKRPISVVGMEGHAFDQLTRHYPALHLQHLNAPMGLVFDSDARLKICESLANSSQAFIFFAVGSPQQEMLAFECAQHGGVEGTALCIGASLDFLVGREKRAPLWLQRLGLEWAFRLCARPAQLWRRYLIEGPAIFTIVAKAARPKRVPRAG